MRERSGEGKALLVELSRFSFDIYRKSKQAIITLDPSASFRSEFGIAFVILDQDFRTRQV
jgi:hypothetical protein